ncbi:MAG: glutaredoxin family protein [Solirubrobacteraceae bacterium]
MSSPWVVLYGRAGCCLCDDARRILERVQTEQPFTLFEVDIDGNDRLLRAYLERIPVVTIDGVEAFELFVDESDLRRRLVADGQSGRSGGTAGISSAPRRPDETH